MKIDLKQLLKDLINFPSITPNDAGCINYIEDLLEKNGFATDIQIFGNNDEAVTNLYARLGDSLPNICFAGHIDVVPPGDLDKWQFDPFIATEHEDKIYGRGTVDMKGAIAAMLAAAIDFINYYKKFKGSISFLITSDEEGPAIYGTNMMLEYLKSKNENIDLVILGEPTSNKEIADVIKIGRRGSINFFLKINGNQGHVAYPEKCDNPIHTLLKIATALTANKLDDGSEYFQPSNLEITSIDVNNNVTNVIPAAANARFNIRFNDLHSKESLVNLVTNVIKSITDKYELSYTSSAVSFIQKPEGIIQEFAEVVKKSINPNVIFSTSGGTSDARFIHKYYPVVECGALNEMAHHIDEYIRENHLQNLYIIYYNALIHYLVGEVP